MVSVGGGDFRRAGWCKGSESKNPGLFFSFFSWDGRGREGIYGLTNRLAG